MNQDSTPTVSRRVHLIALILTVPLPTLGTWLAMVVWPESTVAKVFFGAAKVWLLLAPLVWVKWIERRPIRWPRWSNRGMWAGHGSGLLIAVVIIGAYMLFGRHWVDADEMLAKVAEMSLDRWPLYLAFCIYLSFANSLLEEYFWRWFIYGRLRGAIAARPAGVAAAVVLSALFFTMHHIIALNAYFDWRITTLGSAGVFIGGVTWSILYAKYRNIYAGWVSHIWADLAIFGIGAWMIFGG